MNFCLTIFLAHALGDYYFQSNKMVADKKSNLFKHSVIYSMFLTLGYAFFDFTISALYFGFWLFVTHYIVDCIVIGINEKVSKNYELFVYIFDQFIHIMLIVIAVLIFGKAIETCPKTNMVLLYTTLVSYLIMPSSIFVEKIVSVVTKDEEPKKGFSLDEGSLIGILERLVVFMLGVVGNIGGIGLIIAAKTMVRYGQFNDDKGAKNFQTKYLIGTLSSVLCGVVAYFIYQSLF